MIFEDENFIKEMLVNQVETLRSRLMNTKNSDETIIVKAAMDIFDTARCKIQGKLELNRSEKLAIRKLILARIGRIDGDIYQLEKIRSQLSIHEQQLQDDLK